MNAKTAKLLKELEEMKQYTQQLRNKIKAQEETNIFLKKQVDNLKYASKGGVK